MASRGLLVAAALLVGGLSAPAAAQEVRYAWLDMSYMAQNAEVAGTALTTIPGQFVDVATTDGNGIRFRASAGTWHNLYAFIDYASTDIDVAAVVTNPIGETFDDEDEFDLTNIRGGLGVRIPTSWGRATDFYAELTYDSIDFDFGSFVDEDFDTGNKDVGGAIGVRAMLNDNWQVHAYGRYSSHGELELGTKEFDTDTVFGIGFGWQVVRGLSLVADYETGEWSYWAIGFRLDLDEN